MTDLPVQRTLKRKTSQHSPVADSLNIFYASVGYLGVVYESHLVYLKHELDACAAPESSDRIIETLQSVQSFVSNLVSRDPKGQPLNQTVIEFIEANQPAVQQLAAEGKELVRKIHEERKMP
jgi:hypothetical protein